MTIKRDCHIFADGQGFLHVDAKGVDMTESFLDPKDCGFNSDGQGNLISVVDHKNGVTYYLAKDCMKIQR